MCTSDFIKSAKPSSYGYDVSTAVQAIGQSQQAPDRQRFVRERGK